MSAPPPFSVQVPVPESNDWLPAREGFPMSAELQPAAVPSTQSTVVELDAKLPTVVTAALTTSSPCPDPV